MQSLRCRPWCSRRGTQAVAVVRAAVPVPLTSPATTTHGCRRSVRRRRACESGAILNDPGWERCSVGVPTFMEEL
jgi:hypothetical protein